jgi:hypothetical protein
MPMTMNNLPGKSKVGEKLEDLSEAIGDEVSELEFYWWNGDAVADAIATIRKLAQLADQYEAAMVGD